MDAWMWVLGVSEVEVSAKLGPPHHHLEIPMDISIALKSASGQVGSISLSYNTHRALDDALFIAEETRRSRPTTRRARSSARTG